MYSESPLYRHPNTNTLPYDITAKRYNGEILISRKSVISGINMFVSVFSSHFSTGILFLYPYSGGKATDFIKDPMMKFILK